MNCPNCKRKLHLKKENINRKIKDFGTCDVWTCSGCLHISVLDWRE